MKLQKKIFRFILILFAIMAAGITESHAIGEMSLGVNVGMTYDPNNLEKTINDYNMYMEYYKKEENKKAKISTIMVDLHNITYPPT